MIIANTKELNTNNTVSICNRRTQMLITRRAPRRMYLCDVPLFFERDCSGETITENDINFVRLMGTIVEIKQASSPPPPPPRSSDLLSPPPIHEHTSTLDNKSMNYAAEHQKMVQFVIDDGTGVLEVLSDRREAVGKKNSDNRTELYPGNNNAPLIEQQQVNQDTKHQSSEINEQPPPSTMAILETLLTSSQFPLAVGQTVDCIGRLQSFDDTVKKDCASDATVDNLCSSYTDNRRHISSSSASRIFLAASSISLVNNPQLVTLRQLELSSSSRLDESERLTRNKNIKNNNLRENNNKNHISTPPPPPPKNRILVGGYLERKLNPLYHCNQEGSVQLNLEDAFHYIKHSKDDGGLTSKELASLVGAFEPNEILAVNLTVERLREDCRIYLNQGKWFPM